MKRQCGERRVASMMSAGLRGRGQRCEVADRRPLSWLWYFENQVLERMEGLKG